MPSSSDHVSAPSSSTAGRPRTVSAAVIGNLFEWYDFTIYGFFAPVIASEFFGPGDSTTNLLQAFGVFAVGYFARPLGAIIFGSIGDRLGRRVALLLSLLVMAIPTLGMALIPTWQSVGILSPLLLIGFRLLQGISIGGEFTGAVSYLSEHAGERHRGFSGALTVSTAMLGILLGSLVYTLMDLSMSVPDLLHWGWRWAFGFGLVILVIATILRWGMPASPHFEQAKAEGKLATHPIRTCLREQRGALVNAMLLISAPAMLCYALTVYMSEFLDAQGGLARSTAGLIVTVAIGVSVFVPLIIGAWSDRRGRMPFIRTGFVACMLWSIPLFALAGSGSEPLAWVAVMVGAVILGILQGVYPVTLSEMFPTESRYSGTSIAYNVSFALVGGTFPLVAAWLVASTDSSLSPGWYLLAMTFMAMLFIWRLPETANQGLSDSS